MEMLSAPNVTNSKCNWLTTAIISPLTGRCTIPCLSALFRFVFTSLCITISQCCLFVPTLLQGKQFVVISAWMHLNSQSLNICVNINVCTFTYQIQYKPGYINLLALFIQNALTIHSKSGHSVIHDFSTPMADFLLPFAAYHYLLPPAFQKAASQQRQWTKSGFSNSLGAKVIPSTAPH